MVEFLFWGSLLALAYTYGGYPAFLRVLCFLRPKPVRSDAEADLVPYVTLIVSAYNEQDVIRHKILNCIDQDYPREKLDILVASDSSNDDTETIVQNFAGEGVRLVRCEGRIGKTACLNRAVEMARGEILVFSDANSFYEKSAIKFLVSRFSDPAVGFVTGHTKYSLHPSNLEMAPVGLYAKLETWIKSMESRIGSCVGADGAIFAVRKSLYTPLDPDDINDLVLPLKIVGQGYRGILEERAYCSEKTGESPAEEYMRQVRITSRTLKGILENATLLNPLRHPLFAWQLASHKLTRLVMPFLLILLFSSSLALALRGDREIYQTALACQGISYALGAFGRLRKGQGITTKAASLAHVFVTVNAAVLVGWIKYLRGERYTSWSSRRRTNPARPCRTAPENQNPGKASEPAFREP
ncbi:MAG: glycosyltransferase family 2 protein [candidate division WOR-3 bacterium]